MTTFRTIIIILLSGMLSSCGGGGEQDLRAWMDEQGKGARGKVDPIPAPKEYQPFAYNASNIPDPFIPRKLDAPKGSSRGPDLTRRKEPLEAYPLESLTMVGTLQKGQTTIGLVRNKDNRIFQVRRGNYMGQNFGLITSVGENEITIKELMQDASGDWVEKPTKLVLHQQEQKQ